MRIPVLSLQKHAIKIATWEASLTKGKQHVPSSIILALLRNSRFVCFVLILPIGIFWAFTVFGVCAEYGFPKNENTWVLFFYVAHFIKLSVENWKPVVFQAYFIRSEELTVNFWLELDFLLSFSLCQTENVAQGPIIGKKKKEKKKNVIK